MTDVSYILYMLIISTNDNDNDKFYHKKEETKIGRLL